MIRVVTSRESAARDASAIAAGIPSRALMQRAGAAAAAEIALRYRDRLAGGVLVFAGPGNNGGDAWVVARALASAGASVRVLEPIEAKTHDALAERALALEVLPAGAVVTDPDLLGTAESVVVDGFFGTGGRSGLSAPFAVGAARAAAMRARGGVVAAIDIPSGIDATTGDTDESAIRADCTLSFATVKRGHLMCRDACGDILVLDIGLGGHATLDGGAPHLVDDAFVSAHLPPIGAAAHKGTRKKIAIVGGAAGMAGATVLAARGAMRSGIGMVKLVVDPQSLPVIQEAEPHALAAAWPSTAGDVEHAIATWADAVIIGPGLGRSEASRDVLERVLGNWHGPTLLDADAITLFEGQAERLAGLLSKRAALLTPHPLEFSRVSGVDAQTVLSTRFDVAAPVAGRLGATILLKGVPTIVTSPTGERLVSATGTPALATAGSGDVLSGIAGTVLAQTGDAFIAGAVGAYVHGRAAERVPNRDVVRGISLEDVVGELRESWTFDTRPCRYPILHELPAIGR